MIGLFVQISGLRIHFNQKINQRFPVIWRQIAMAQVWPILSCWQHTLAAFSSLCFTAHGISQAICLPICHWWAVFPLSDSLHEPGWSLGRLPEESDQRSPGTLSNHHTHGSLGFLSLTLPSWVTEVTVLSLPSHCFAPPSIRPLSV